MRAVRLSCGCVDTLDEFKTCTRHETIKGTGCLHCDYGVPIIRDQDNRPRRHMALEEKPPCTACPCGQGPTGSYEGPLRSCPIHGEEN